LSGWPIDVEAALKASGKSFRSTVQNQRSALTILNDTLYVPYGGHFGDCGDYHGWVVGVSLQPPHATRVWATRARGGGIWAPGGLVSDGRNLYAVTGNTFGARTWADGEDVVRLGPTIVLGQDAGFSRCPIGRTRRHGQRSRRDNALLLNLPGAKPAELVSRSAKTARRISSTARTWVGSAAACSRRRYAEPDPARRLLGSLGDEGGRISGQGVDRPQGVRDHHLAIVPAAPRAHGVVCC
jgi:hypothetical protein